MKKSFNLLILLLVASTSIISCSKSDDSLTVPKNIEVQDFIWKGLNLYY